ncbi:DUF2796 domain-containing protein [Sedimenticola selenatireducens]|nr:DUF2796 domain-containing protein [Sedimenticola selenatireducens]
MRYSKITLLLLLTFGMVLSVHSEENRQHGVHEHGGGQLNVVVEKNTLMMDLSIPAMNVVGFEHPARNDDEQKQLEHSSDLLRDGSRIFMPSPSAKCVLEQVKIESALLETHANHDAEEGHADFDVSYLFACAEPMQLKSLTLTLFKMFPLTEHLQVQMITPAGQTGTELESDNPILNLQ